MYKLKKIGNTANIPFEHFVCDEKSDLDQINIDTAIMGSTCYVINDGDTYILNSNKEWKLYRGAGSSTGGSGGGNNTPDTGSGTIIYDGGGTV